MKILCENCQREKHEIEFWQKKAGKFSKDPRITICKQCCCNRPNCIDFLMKELNIPFIEPLFNQYDEYNLKGQLGRYIALMRLRGYYGFKYKDSKRLNKMYEGD
jgi:hypothetical protein